VNLKTYLTDLLPRVVKYRLARLGLARPALPITLTFSVTNRCQSRCRTCLIWQLYRDHPARADEELTLDEIERTFRSMGHIYFFNVSGGEPFLRDDLPEIVELAMRHLTPGIVHIPTNALAPGRIERGTERILEIIERMDPRVPLTVKPSFDGVGALHDEIRGVPGNWERLLDTIDRLKRLAREHANLHVELGTVVSRLNAGHLDEIAAYAHSLGVESYRNEVAEQRAEFFNEDDPITPSGEEYARLMKGFARRTRAAMGGKRRLARITESFRLVYYEYAGRILRTGRQVLPCYAGLSNVHLNPYGEVWPCCVLAYHRPMGNVRETGYDFIRVWHSRRADEVRRFIADRGCACPLANQAYSNILCNLPAVAAVIRNIIRADRSARRRGRSDDSRTR